MSERDSQIILSKGIKMDRDYRNCLTIGSSALIDVMLSSEHLVATGKDYSFINSTGTIRTGFTYQQCLHANYIAFNNLDYDSMYFFAWIDEVIYRSDRCTELKYTIDYFSTWWDKITPTECLVLRETPTTDYIGYSRTLESSNVDNYICRETYNIDVAPSGIAALFTEARKSDGTYVSPYEAYTSAGIYEMDGLPMTLWRVSAGLTSSGFSEIMSYYGDYVVDGKADSLVGLFLYPQVATAITTLSSKITSIDGYTPTNKKCLQYPYVKVLLSNNQGGTIELRQEDFNDGISFKYASVRNYRGQSVCYPFNYKGISEASDYGLLIDNYPTIPMTKDNFLTYIAQNSTNVMLSAVRGGITGVSTALTGNPLGAVMGLSSLANTLGNIYNASIVPDSVSGMASGNLINKKLDNFKFTVQIYTAPVDVIKSADSYFSKYGYNVGEYKVPSTNKYVQISADSVIGFGDVPANAMQVINNAFRNGVTLWHSH